MGNPVPKTGLTNEYHVAGDEKKYAPGFGFRYMSTE